MKLRKILMLSIGACWLILAITFPWNQALAQQRGFDGWGMGPDMMGSWGMGWFGMIFMMIFWVLVIVGLVLLIKWLIQTTGSRQAAVQAGSGAVDILRERYARGEINKAEFESMKRDLS